MIPTGTRVTARQANGALVSGSVVMSWHGGLAIKPDSPCKHFDCPYWPSVVCVHDEDIVIRMKGV